ncbi:DegT/DnrJ/EryC1/StrS aminotransferase [Methylorubrum extorquens CM4]|uniref:DegT/DnrJ/EryC1/StrS aminotransferase n=2 Tax=Methylorubrum extorquens TaxID=408 RepID=B7KYP0_METC4|nr:DegT/DnrJ/EryC1/StrS aminotransferase [Methylorubrum extorquens CM4]
MIPLAIPNLAGREAEYLQECVATTFVSTVGPFVGRFEAAVAAAAGAEAAVSTSAGTTAIHAALVALGVERDDLVIVPALTFIATVSGIHWAGGRPWFAESAPESWTLDPGRIETLLAREVVMDGTGVARHRATGLRVKAMVPVYTLGNPPDMDRLVEVARRYGLSILADAAAALGATYRGRPLGEFGADLSIISFNGNKTVTAGGGGAVVGKAELIDRVRHLVTTARVGSDYLHDAVGFNYRITNIQAAVGLAQMERLDALVERKREIRRRYDDAFEGVPGLRPFPSPEWGRSADWFSGVVVEGMTEPGMKRFVAGLRKRRIDARPFWIPMHLQPPLQHHLADDLTFTEGLWHQVLTLPCSTSLTHADQDHVVAAVRAQLAAG